MSRDSKALWGGVLGVLTAGALALSSGPVRAATEPGQQAQARRLRPDTLFPDNQDVLPSLADVAPIEPLYADLQDKDTHEVKRWPAHHVPLTAAQLKLVQDPARQGAASGAAAPVMALSATAGLNFDGAGLPSYSPTGAPPDTNGAVGATQYVQWVNTSFAVFNKTTGAMVYGPAAGNTLWSGLGGR